MIRITIIAFLMTLTSWSCGEAKGNTTSELKPDDPELKLGKKMYNRFCVPCHGPKGDLGLTGAANLKTSSMPFEEMVDVVTNGRGKMNAHSGIMKKEEIKAVVRYIDEKLKKEKIK